MFVEPCIATTREASPSLPKIELAKLELAKPSLPQAQTIAISNSPMLSHNCAIVFNF